MLAWNHYEVAFEAFLRERRIPFLAVEERHRNQLEDGTTLKNLDFVISRPTGTSWLIDVKGRKFPGGKQGGGYWKHWSTRDDLLGIRQWESIFGSRFSGLFVFAYQICGNKSPLPPERLFEFRNRLYGFVGISLKDYLSEIRLLSPRWHTFSMPTNKFRSLAKPFEDFMEE
jgi:hypothetical protein